MRKYDLVYSEKYKDAQGEEKTSYKNIGSVFERPDGSLYAKVDSIPVNFSGWVNFYEPKMKQEGYSQAKQAASAPDNNDEIPWR